MAECLACGRKDTPLGTRIGLSEFVVFDGSGEEYGEVTACRYCKARYMHWGTNAAKLREIIDKGGDVNGK